MFTSPTTQCLFKCLAIMCAFVCVCCALQSRALFQDHQAGGPSQHCMLVMSQVVAGLSALHQRGIVHRGKHLQYIYPSNPVFRHEGIQKRL